MAAPAGSRGNAGLRLRALLLRVPGLRGWRRVLTATAAGGSGALAMPPFGTWPVLAAAFPLLILLLDGCRGPLRSRLIQSAGIGWWFGFGYFLASLWWIGAAFLVEADVFGWLMPFAVLAMPAGLALFFALAAVIAQLLWSPTAYRLFALAFAFGLCEWLRGHVLTGFPWNTFAYAFAQSLPLMQGAALLGTYGLNIFVVLVMSAPVLLLDRRRSSRIAAAAATVLLGLAALWGTWRIAATPTEFVDGVRLRIMQPNLRQDQKFNYARRREILAHYLELSNRPTPARPDGLAEVTTLIWPESAFPFLYEREPWAAQDIAAALPPQVTLVTGAIRHGAPPPGQHSPFFNAIRVIDHAGNVLTSTDKVHLVPFGEYLPLQSTLESFGIEQLTRVRGGFSAGEELRLLPIPGLPLVAPLICYEIIFPGKVIPEGPRPGLLLNLTNDAWFGMTPGPYQHFAQARLRAVEEGLPLLRAANTGISAVIDPIGRIVASTGLGEEAVVDAGLPKPLKTVTPAGARAGAAVWVLLFAALILGLIPFRRMLHAEVDRRL